VSARLDASQFLVTPGRPLGQLAPGALLVRCPLEGELPAAALPEVRMHQAIYRVRPDVEAICRFQAPALMALSALGRTPRALHGLGAYFAPGAPLFDDPGLVRDLPRATAVARALGLARAIVLRGNGALSVGSSLHAALALAWCLEDAARVELAVLSTGLEPTPYTAAQAAERSSDPRLIERLWDFLVGGEPALAREQR
jgi:HCOMODA/2-hydroxy-3-carboxy-muconic semialdehyde decarboxylase